ncbi:small ubiquitin-related modifier 1-like [Morus notabilis]|uniref:small ubiquitin-related modifier 1-like n=1 Tax=Morus notabilis TaxID=981085 RepID=UPI000CED1856|nr:small ubiquitin-related modifier 1-like [Morus notabilis]
MGESSEKKKSMDGEKEVPCVKIHVKHQDKPSVFFKVRTSQRLFKVLSLYCERHNLDYKTMRFVFDGARVLPTHTPSSLHMRDGDQIDVLGNADGGGGGTF